MADSASTPPSILASVEDDFLSAANGDSAAQERIIAVLEARRPALLALWPPAERDAWRSGADMVLETVNRAAPTDMQCRFLRVLLRAGCDTPLCRDVAAAVARRAFASYPDPAGLIRAFGLQNRELSTALAAERWELFEHLTPGCQCFLPAQGVGQLLEVDGYSNSVVLQFGVRRALPLALAIESLVVIRAASPLHVLLSQPRTWHANLPPDQFRAQAAASILPPGRWRDEWLTQILCPAVLSESDLHAFMAGPRVPGVTTDPRVAGPQRHWFEARSMEELADLLAGSDKVTLGAAESTALRDLLVRFGGKPEWAGFLAQAVAHLWRSVQIRPALIAELQARVHDIAVWQHAELFSDVSDGLPGRLVQPWLEVTLAAAGIDWVCETALILPFRLLAPLEKALAASEAGDDLLIANMFRSARLKAASPDVLLWLWRAQPDGVDDIADASLVFKTLAKPVHGSYHKARKELLKLLLEDEKFQRFMMQDGDSDAIASVVACARHVPLLTGGEQQSLLVKIVRLFPEARHLVEERSLAKIVRPIGKMTSLRSFELRRRELDEIITVKIPANSRAIAHARGYGDLRENAEFKAAKEQQRLLRLQRAELERAIHEVRAFDFGTMELGDNVAPGCCVTLAFADGREETYTLLGVWDGDVDKRYLSYESGIGIAVTGRHAGETIELPNGGAAVLKTVAPLPADLLQWLRGEDLL